MSAWAVSEAAVAEVGAPAAVADTMVDAVIVNARAPYGGPTVSVTGANAYGATSDDIANLAAGENAALTDVLSRMPGVSLDQNQQIHIRDTEGPQFQYQINGVLVPLDINTNPSFLSMINPLFIKRLDLLDGVLPARYGEATGGVVDIVTKDGCADPGGIIDLFGGQRETAQVSATLGGCAGALSYFVSGLYGQSNTAFSSATPGADAVHDHQRVGQAFASLAYAVNPDTQVGLIASASASNNQLPNVPGLPPQFALAGAAASDSATIKSTLDFRDYLAILSMKGQLSPGLTYQVAYAIHSIAQAFRPDDAGELIYQGVASWATHVDFDNTLQGDLKFDAGKHTLSAGVYAGAYHVNANDRSLVFAVDASGAQASDSPYTVTSQARATNVVVALYAEDLWRLSEQVKLDLGLRWDGLTGFTNHRQLDPSINLVVTPGAGATIHAGFARYMQVPTFQGVSPNAQAAFAGTTASSPPGVANPLTEDDYEFDGGLTQRLNGALTLSLDGYYERTDRYLDTGQFGVTPIFAPFNYGRGSLWGVEAAAKYRRGRLSAYANLTVGENRQIGVITGQFNFDRDELAYINTHSISLDHQPLVGASGGFTYAWRTTSISVDGLYSSGLRGGFADEARLPQVIQFNAALEHRWRMPGLGEVANRLTILNLFDRVNLIRPAEGIGIFQSAYGPRLTVLDSISLKF